MKADEPACRVDPALDLGRFLVTCAADGCAHEADADDLAAARQAAREHRFATGHGAFALLRAGTLVYPT